MPQRLNFDISTYLGGLADPQVVTDAATKNYVDTSIANVPSTPLNIHNAGETVVGTLANSNIDPMNTDFSVAGNVTAIANYW